MHSEDAVEQPLVVLASERMDSDPGWRLLDRASCCTSTRLCSVSTQTILRAAPAHPLTIDDLNPHAKASQAATPE